MAATIQVEGMKELRRALRKYAEDNGYRDVLRDAYGATATLVQDAARASASGSRMGSAAVASISAKGSTTNATLKAGAGIPYYAGNEFGSRRFHQFPITKAGGYHLYPTIAAKRQEITEIFMERLEAGLESEFSW